MRLSWIVALLLSKELSIHSDSKERSVWRGTEMQVRGPTSHREFKKQVEKPRRISERLGSRELFSVPGL
jgi:hypothetical protein